MANAERCARREGKKCLEKVKDERGILLISEMGKVLSPPPKARFIKEPEEGLESIQALSLG